MARRIVRLIECPNKKRLHGRVEDQIYISEPYQVDNEKDGFEMKRVGRSA